MQALRGPLALEATDCGSGQGPQLQPQDHAARVSAHWGLSFDLVFEEPLFCSTKKKNQNQTPRKANKRALNASRRSRRS